MNNFNVQVLFLHNITPNNKEVTIQNFNSFVNNNTDILGLHDDDQEGLEGAIKVTKNGNYIPRGNVRWCPDNVFLNYILSNKDNLNHSHYMLCEYDCYTECNINELCNQYSHYDIVAPVTLRYSEDPNWTWWNLDNSKIIDKEKLIGFRPSVFILVKKEALIKIAEFYTDFWSDLKNTNSEARLGIVSKLLDLSVGNFDPEIAVNSSWYTINFLKSNKLYHPVKELFSSMKFISLNLECENSELLNTKWSFGQTAGKRKLGTLYFGSKGAIGGYNNFNEKFWEEKNDNLYIYNAHEKLTTLFTRVDEFNFIGGYYDYKPSNEVKFYPNVHFLKKIKS